MAKITIVVVNNPFDLNNRTIKQVDHVVVKTLAGYVNDITNRFDDQDFAVSVNGHVIPPDQWTNTSINAGSYVAICPIVGKGGGGGKNVLGIIVGIALSVVSMGVGNLARYGVWSGAAASAGMAGWGLGGYLAAAATMFIGGSLISGNAALSTASIDTDFTSTSTYTWSKSQPLTGQGYPLGITYGTVSPTPIVLAQHVSSDGDKQYLNMLLCVGEGPLDAIEDIRINDNPVANYDGVTIETRLGTNDQLAIAGFNDEFVDQALSYELTTSNGWATQLADGSSAQGLEAEFNFSSGLYYAANDGSLANASVTLQAQYRLVGAENWNDRGTWTVTAAQSSAVIRTYRIDGLAEGQYEVRCKCVSKSGESSRYATRVYWTQLSQILKEEFSRPGKALIALKALATDQLSGSMPAITCKTTRSNVWVLDPSTSTYVQKPANSPAWACYDLIHRAKKLNNIQTSADEVVAFGAPYGRMTYSEFAAWADECVTKNLTANLFIDAASELWKALADIEGIGRGKVVMKGTRYGAIFDSAADPVQLFTVGNIIADTFTEEFLAMKDRANAIEITFTNAAKNYQRDTITVYADDYNESDRVASPTQITLNGITSLDQAYREGKYRLRLNKYMTRTVSFEASIDAIACQVGDVILVQHDVTQWGFGGRIASATRGETTDALILDREVELSSGKTYSVMVRNSQTDEIVQRTIETPAETTTTDTLTVEQFPDLPKEFDVYTFGEIDVEAKPFRVVTITRSSDMTRKITALEYVEAVYTEATDIPTIEYSALSGSIGLTVTESVDLAGNLLVNLSWKASRGMFSKFVVTVDGKQVATLGASDNQYSFSVNTKATYSITVSGYNFFGSLTATATKSYNVTAEAPPDVDSYYVTQNMRNLEHNFAVHGSISGVEIRKVPNDSPDWDNGQVVVSKAAGTKYVDSAISVGTSTYAIKAIGKNGVYSANARTFEVKVDYIPSSNIIVAKKLFPPDGSVTNGSIINNAIVPAMQSMTWEQFAEKYPTWGDYAAAATRWGEPTVEECVYTSEVYDLGKVMTSLVAVDYGLDGGSGSSVAIEWRYSQDNETWADWSTFISGSATFRYHQWRFRLLSSDGSMTMLNDGSVSIDVPDLVQKYSITITDAASGATITFGQVYIETPTATANLVDGQAGAVTITKTTTGATLKAYSFDGTALTGAVDAQFIGY